MAGNNRRKKKECCSLNFTQIYFYVFDFIFFLAGVGVLGASLWITYTKSELMVLTTNAAYKWLAYVLMSAGAISLVVAIFGFFAVWKRNQCCVMLYLFLLVLIFLLEVTVGVLALTYSKMNIVSKESLKEVFSETYGVSEAETMAIDKLQQEYKCCGAETFENWEDTKWQTLIGPKTSTNKLNGTILYNFVVPDSCCTSMSKSCGKSLSPSNIPYLGCIYRFNRELSNRLAILCMIGLGFSVIEIFGMFLSCCLYIKMGNYSPEDL